MGLSGKSMRSMSLGLTRNFDHSSCGDADAGIQQNEPELAQALAESLALNNSLTSINLAGCSIRDEILEAWTQR